MNTFIKLTLLLSFVSMISTAQNSDRLWYKGLGEGILYRDQFFVEIRNILQL